MIDFRRPSTSKRVAVFREEFLPPSETFIRDHLLFLPTWEPVAVAVSRVENGLAVPGIEVVGATTRSFVARARRLVARISGASAEARAQSALADAFRKANVAVVHAHFGPDGALALDATKQAGLPLIVTFHGYDASMSFEELSKSWSGGARLVDRWDELMESAAAIITVSEFLRNELLARGARAEKLHVIPCGVDTASLSWSPPPPDGGIIFVGRLVEKKGCGDLIEAVAGMARNPGLRIIGDGPLRQDLEEQAERLGVSVEFMGVRDSNEVKAAMQASSIVAMPSRRASNGDAEGLPVVSLEASALGRPVVGYSHSGLVESVVNAETGILLEEGDVEGLTASLEAILGSPDVLQRLARNARVHVERRFDIRTCLAQVEEIYSRVSGVEGGNAEVDDLRATKR
jgi:colanic acid/amylovoran biosynthesis glycosyltransferase